MMSERTSHLIEAWLDGLLDDAGVAELEAAVLGSAEVRRVFWDRVAFHGLIHEAAKMRFDGAAVAPAIEVRGSGGVSSWKPGWLGMLASGFLAAAFVAASVVASMAWTSSGPRRGGVVVHEEGFERPPAPAPDYLPQEFDVWSGDETCVVAAERGITPQSGRRMLRFVASQPSSGGYAGEASEIWRIIDLESLGLRRRPEGVVVELAAVFNGVPVTDRTIPAGGIVIIATDTKPGIADQPWLEKFGGMDVPPMNVAVARMEEVLDEDPATWQRLTAIVNVPSRARYLVLHCHVEGRPLTGEASWRPSGQYIDDISVTVFDRHPAAVSASGRGQGDAP